MSDMERWAAVDRYVDDLVVRPDRTMEQATSATAEAGMPPIAVSAAQGKLLHLIARMSGARRILEIGTLGGYSTIWLARALPPEGRLISLEIDPRHAEVARANLAEAGLADRAEVQVGPALATLEKLAQDRQGDFDLTFIDADKVNIPEYFGWAVTLSRPGAAIVVDNVVRNGELIDTGSHDPSVQGVRRFHEQLAGMADRVSLATSFTLSFS